MTVDATAYGHPVAHRRINWRRLLAVFLLLLGCGGYVAYAHKQARKPYEWSGTVEARSIAIGSRTGGRVKQVLAREGDRVEAGQPILVLEPGDLEAQLTVAEGQLAQAESERDKLVKGARPEEIMQAKARAAAAAATLEENKRGARSEEIAAAEARLSAAEAALEKIQRDAERYKGLVASGAISRMEAEAAESDLKQLQAQRDAQKHALDELVNGTRRERIRHAEALAMEAQASAKLVSAGTRVEDLRAAEAAVKIAQGRLDAIRAQMDELTVRAPVAARLDALDLRPGDILHPNATAATLVEDDALYVRIYVPETQLGLVRVGDAVPITVDTFGDRSFQGVVRHISSVGEFSPRNLQTADERANQVFATRIDITENRELLRAGMSALTKVPRP
ncbi:HlyD family secretion protein [Sorangium sp. So ce426]|uniref:HlyD family secretion protein n=1 Tax=unclassified Sorangium TaxID=2621164 RepID=UPI003F5B4D34